MNPSPRKFGQELPAFTNHVESMQNRARIFWQSFMTRDGARAELPNLTDIPKLARAIRNAATNIATDADTTAIAEYFAGAITGIAHRAITPDCEPQLARVDRSPVATAHEAGWGIRTDEAGGFTVTPCRDACEANAARFAANWPQAATHPVGVRND